MVYYSLPLRDHIDKVTSYIVGLMLGVLTSLGPFILPAKRAIDAIENARKQSQANYNKEHHQRLASLEQECRQIQNEIDAAQKKVKDASENVKRLEWHALTDCGLTARCQTLLNKDI